MALIGKIRQNTVIVLLFIGGGIALFILSEMTSGAGGALGPVMNRMGAVGEREIDRNDFERTASAAFSGGDAFQNRDQLWNFYVNEAVVKNEAEELGLSVSQDEMTELQYGANPSPVVRRNLTDPNTGQLNTTLLAQIRQDIENNSVDAAIQEGRLNPNFKSIWTYQRREIEASRLQEKMTALMTKAMYAPNWQAQDYADEQFGNRKVAIVKVPFEEVDDTDVEVSNADVQAFIDENRSIFDNPEETRQLSYLAFEVTPTQADSNEIRTTLNEIADDWRKEESETADSLFALSNNGSYQAAYQTAERFSPIVADAAINQAAVGSVYGPYIEGNAMKLMKVVDRVTMSDSAKTRHILRNASTPSQFDEANRVIDSLMSVVQRNRRKFADLAEEFSQDPGSASNGGVYEKVTPGQFVKPFDNVLFRTGSIGSLYKVRTQYGVHLVDVMSRSRSTQPRAKVAYIVEPIIPSSATEDAVMAKAQTFLNGKKSLSEMKSAAEGMGMVVKTSAPLPISNYTLADLGSGQDVKDMMCWAYSASKGDVSPVVYSFTDQQLFYQNNHVIIGLADVLAKGLPSAASVKDALQDQVRNRVKGQKLADMLAGKDLDAVAAQYEVTIDSISSNPTLQSLPGIGQEPKVIAAAASVASGSTSKPIVGRNGVYFVKPLGDASTGTSGNLPIARSQINTTVRAQNGNVLLPALRAGTTVADERAAGDCQ
jgi:peptidyl-prolyl cis-trans isomerase D